MAEAKLSPMMEQYVKTKEQYKDCILMYRVGDFFEMFFDDAILVSKELELVLTGKECGLEEKAPMAGIPFHAVDNYISKLLSKGYKVAVCDQVEDPKLAKGLVKREITKIVTPGTNTNVLDLDETKNNYIFCVFGFSSEFGIAVCDVSTGDFYAMKVNSVRNLINEIQKYTPKELVGNSALIMASIPEGELLQRFNLRLQIISDTY
ncbi:MAG: DNA mismatch repair protein MutS, partial [Lachnospiraceae bacterium]|nr:DNA mismatch repair protein MutS [Lachnospiraceae bacterium]